MQKNSVLIVGNDGAGASEALGGGACIARTTRFYQVLLHAGFKVDVFSPVTRFSSGIKEHLAENHYDCVIAISPHPGESAAITNINLPLWIDMNGMHPAEILLTSDTETLPRTEMLRILAMENILLSRGDFFSAPSKRQTYAILGELLLLGRLKASSKLNVPVQAIPHCAIEIPELPKVKSDDNCFQIISTGSFNSWFDSETLFNGLIYAMEKNDSIFFTATGGAVPFAREQYELFMEKLSNSKLKDRFRMAGWVSKEELENIYSAADLAVYTDNHSIETLLGARTRVLDWISRSIPVLCTEGAEISETISRYGLGLTVPQQSPEALGKAILKFCSNSDLISEIKEKQIKWREGIGSMTSVFKPLIKWCLNPKKIPPGQLCSPTVPQASSKNYRKMVFKEIQEKTGTGKALKFLWTSIETKIKDFRN